MASIVSMVNSSLNLLGASNIASLTEDTKNARLCNQRYESVRDRVFRSHNWNCLIKRTELAQESTFARRNKEIDWSLGQTVLAASMSALE